MTYLVNLVNIRRSAGRRVRSVWVGHRRTRLADWADAQEPFRRGGRPSRRAPARSRARRARVLRRVPERVRPLRVQRSRAERRAGRKPPPILLPLVVGRTREQLALSMTVYAVPAYRVLDESGLKGQMDATLAALAEPCAVENVAE